MQVQLPRPRPTGLHGGATRAHIPDLPQIVGLVGPDLVRAEGHLADMVGSVVPAVETIARYLVDSGGKRLRPLLTALSAHAIGFEGDLAGLMCVGELVHLGSLLHDDVIDDGHERRGQPTAHRVFANAGVILTGDFCLARSVMLAAETGGRKAVYELGRTITDMSEGEIMQLMQAGSFEISLERYRAIIDKKSATLIGWCAAAPAWAAQDDVAADALNAYGRAVGTAFQITDDVLDYTGELGKTGKRRGQDLAEGKPTLPVIFAMERDPSLRTRLAAGPPSPERIPALLEAVRATGATDAALAEAHAHVAAGLEALEALPEGPHRDALAALGHHLVDRVA